MNSILIAVGLVLVIEGIGPALFANGWRNMLVKITQQPEKQLKSMGSVMIILGGILVFIATH